MKLPSGRVVWGSALVALSAVETYGVRHGGSGYTLSEVIRSTCRTDTRLGRVVFAANWTALTIWFVPHILKDRSAEADYAWLER